MSAHSASPPPTSVRPFTLAHAEVTTVSEVTPNMVRVSLGGPGLVGVTSGGYDQRVKLLLPPSGQRVPNLPAADNWFENYRAMDEDVRPVLRSYTIREHRPDTAEVDIEFALHGDHGPASRWARRAETGDVVGLVAPDVRHMPISGVEYRPEGADWQLIVGDETALPAIASILEALPAGAEVRAFIEVPEESDVREFDTGGCVQFTWLPRSSSEDGKSRLLDAVRRARFPGGRPYAWTAGESGVVRALRRHLVEDRGWDRQWIYFGGYWRLGLAEGAPETGS